MPDDDYFTQKTSHPVFALGARPDIHVTAHLPGLLLEGGSDLLSDQLNFL